MTAKVRAFFLSVTVAAYVLCSGGCTLDATQRIALLETAVTQAQTAADVATANITALQTQLAEAQRAGVDSATLAAIRAKLDAALAVQPDVDAFLAKARDSLAKARANPTMQGEIELYASLFVSALGVGATAWFRRKAKQAVTDYERQAETSADLAAQYEGHRNTLGTLVRAVESMPQPEQQRLKEAISKIMAKQSDCNAVIDRTKEDLRTG